VIKACGQFAVFLYDGNFPPGKIISFNVENVYISTMTKSLKSWKWLQKPNMDGATCQEALILRNSCQSEDFIPTQSYQHFLCSRCQVVCYSVLYNIV
jgi:hypothetical protein